jgi:uncharacterized ion transporter superfamily protein YfcC
MATDLLYKEVFSHRWRAFLMEQTEQTVKIQTEEIFFIISLHCDRIFSASSSSCLLISGLVRRIVFKLTGHEEGASGSEAEQPRSVITLLLKHFIEMILTLFTKRWWNRWTTKSFIKSAI